MDYSATTSLQEEKKKKNDFEQKIWFEQQKNFFAFKWRHCNALKYQEEVL